MRTLFLISGLCFLVSACGFAPVYGEHKNEAPVEEALQQVEIANIPDREGQYLRNALIDRFYRGGYPVNPQYDLEISALTQNFSELDVTKEADATRSQLSVSTRMILRQRGSGEIILTRDLRAITSYNIVASEFATRVSRENARQNALDELARQAELLISLYFRRETPRGHSSQPVDRPAQPPLQSGWTY